MNVFLILAGVLVCAGVAVFVAWRASAAFLIRRADKTRALCVCKGHRRTRVPGVWTAVMEYPGTNHKRYVAATRGMLRSRLPKVGSRRYGTVCRVTGRDGRAVRWVELRLMVAS